VSVRRAVAFAGLGAGLAGLGVVVVRALAPRLPERCVAGCRHMVEQIPHGFPPAQEERSGEARGTACGGAR